MIRYLKKVTNREETEPCKYIEVTKDMSNEAITSMRTVGGDIRYIHDCGSFTPGLGAKSFAYSP